MVLEEEEEVEEEEDKEEEDGEVEFNSSEGSVSEVGGEASTSSPAVTVVTGDVAVAVAQRPKVMRLVVLMVRMLNVFTGESGVSFCYFFFLI